MKGWEVKSCHINHKAIKILKRHHVFSCQQPPLLKAEVSTKRPFLNGFFFSYYYFIHLTCNKWLFCLLGGRELSTALAWHHRYVEQTDACLHIQWIQSNLSIKLQVFPVTWLMSLIFTPLFTVASVLVSTNFWEKWLSLLGLHYSYWLAVTFAFLQ